LLKNSFFIARIETFRAEKGIFFVFLARKHYILALNLAYFFQLGFSDYQQPQ